MTDRRSDSSPDPGLPAPDGDRSSPDRRIAYRVVLAFIVADAVLFASVGLGAFHRGKESASFQSPTTSQAPEASPSLVPIPSPSPLRPCDRPILIGTVSVDQIAARVAPDPSARVIETFGRENVLGTPQVFDLVEELSTDGGIWYKALLPIRPNGTIGFIPGNALKVASTTFHMVVDRAKVRLTLFKGCDKMKSFPVGIGTGATPTPVGKFYLTGLFKPPDPTTIYGVSIYTLSGFSEVLTNWKLGGIIGLHGTNDPSSIGRNSSHGCIRMRNEDILTLEKILPLGTPIVIH